MAISALLLSITFMVSVFMWGLDLSIQVFQWEPLILFALPIGALILDYVDQKWPKLNSNQTDLLTMISDPATKTLQISNSLYQMMTTWWSHLFGASVGRESTAVLIGGGVANELYYRFKMEFDRSFYIKLGVAGAFAVAFGTPIAAAVYCIEFLKKSKWSVLEISMLLLFTYSCEKLSSLIGLKHPLFDRISEIASASPELSISWFSVVVFMGLAVSLTPAFYKLWSWLFKGLPNNKKRRVGSLLFVLLIFSFAGLENTSLGTLQIESAFTRQMDLTDLFWRLALTSLCVSSFLRGGDFTPLLAAGSIMGGLFASTLGLPFYQGAALGFGAIVSQKHSIPITGTLLCLELFNWQYSILFIGLMGSAQLWSLVGRKFKYRL